MSPDPIQRARDLARAAHGDQRYGQRPYRVHLEAVVAALEASGPRWPAPEAGWLIQAGWLHDVIEDTAMDAAALLAAGVPAAVVGAVEFCSDAEGETRKRRKAATYARCAADRARWEAAPEDAALTWVRIGVVAKVADRIANMEACVAGPARLRALYQAEAPAFRAALFSAGLCDHLWARFDALVGGP